METFGLENKPKIPTGFITPEDYFEYSRTKILNQLLDNKTEKVLFFRRNRMLYLGIAAVLILVLFTPIYFRLITNLNNEKLDLADLENHIMYHTPISSYELISENGEERMYQSKTNLKEDFIEDILATSPDLEQLILDPHP